MILMKKHILAFLITWGLFLTCSAQKKHLDVGDSIPAFSLQDQNGKTFDTKDYVGKKILVVYFYPKDESSVCTKEACGFRDSYADFTAAGALVVGINSASVESHKSFQQHRELPFILLSDPNNQVLHQFGVGKKMGITGRETFVIDLNGKIRYAFNALLSGNEHSQKALAFIKTMSGK